MNVLVEGQGEGGAWLVSQSLVCQQSLLVGPASQKWLLPLRPPRPEVLQAQMQRASGFLSLPPPCFRSPHCRWRRQGRWGRGLS